MTASEADGIRRELSGIDERLSRIELRLETAARERDACELRCAEKRGPIYNRLGALEVTMGKIGLQAAILIAVAAFLGSTVAAAVLAAVSRALSGG